jgi:hypothetical protein
MENQQLYRIDGQLARAAGSTLKHLHLNSAVVSVRFELDLHSLPKTLQ